MDLRLGDKAALVTGGSRGLGLAIARWLGAEGARVALLARDPHRLQQAVEDIRIDGIEFIGAVADTRRGPALSVALHGDAAVVGRGLRGPIHY